MNLNEYFGFPEGTNAVLRYSNFYDIVDSNFPCQKNMSHNFSYEVRICLKQINVTNDTTSLDNIFTNCLNLEYIEGLENWDVSNVENMGYMFYSTSSSKLKYIEGLENWNVSKVTNMTYMFYGCSSLTDLSFISNWDTSKVTSMDSMFNGCGNLVTLGSIRCDSVTFGNYDGMFGSTSKLVNFGGLINLKSQLIYSSYSLNKCPNLSYESCINVLNGLYDFVGNGVTPTSTQAKLLVHQNFLDKVGDEISIGVNKGWQIYA